MSPWVPIVVLALLLVAYLACDVMYWVGYFDGRAAARKNLPDLKVTQGRMWETEDCEMTPDFDAADLRDITLMKDASPAARVVAARMLTNRREDA